MYLGHLPMHARTVSLVLNLSTGLVSPQFHLKFDDFFETIDDLKDCPIDQWKLKCHFVSPPVHTNNDVQVSKGETTVAVMKDQPQVEPPSPPQGPPQPMSNLLQEQGSEVDDSMEAQADKSNVSRDTPLKWSARHKPTWRLQESMDQRGLVYSSILDDVDGDKEIQIQTWMSDPIAYAASSDPDTMYLNQAMKQPDKRQFILAMVEEMEAHTSNNHWKLILKSQVPPGTKILPSVWAMKRKR